jgi:catechol 2,3-dioxygenase-like lactoylglutathione lyase family enzyme
MILGELLMEMKLELVAIPVTDVDRARDFYKDKVGFNLDQDHTVNEKLRFVQMTPPGSACSICFGIGIADNMKPGSIKGLQMVVKDAQAAHDELKKRGVNVTGVDAQVWGKLVHFNDPDGNSWTLQELPSRGGLKV